MINGSRKFFFMEHNHPYFLCGLYTMVADGMATQEAMTFAALLIKSFRYIRFNAIGTNTSTCHSTPTHTFYVLKLTTLGKPLRNYVDPLENVALSCWWQPFTLYAEHMRFNRSIWQQDSPSSSLISNWHAIILHRLPILRNVSLRLYSDLSKSLCISNNTYLACCGLLKGYWVPPCCRLI